MTLCGEHLVPSGEICGGESFDDPEQHALVVIGSVWSLLDGKEPGGSEDGGPGGLPRLATARKCRRGTASSYRQSTIIGKPN
jgi:hypothetical protein